MQESETNLLTEAIENNETAPRFELLELSREERKRRRASFGVGTCAQILVAGLVLWLLTSPPSSLEGPNANNKEWPVRITLVAPPAVRITPRLRAARAPAPPLPKPAVELPKPAPAPIVPRLPKVVTARVQPRPAPRLPVVHPVPRETEVFKPNVSKWQSQTHVGTFASSHAVAKLRLPPSRVQTGGFGSPNGLPGYAEGGSKGNVPHLGSFDMPDGPGSGNGTGGARGARGVVASAGFGNGVAAAPGDAHGAPGGQVHEAGFADAQSLAQAAPRTKPQPEVAAYEPVDITAKPDPVYTAEARRLHIQGEVLLRVVFKASGHVQILGVEQGLGHGLDEAAIRAAQQIQFKPARRNGQPVDTPATLHILFELAN